MAMVDDVIVRWAARHPEIIGVGGKAKDSLHSEYDYSVALAIEPTLALVEELAKDLALARPSDAFIFSMNSRHSAMIGKKYQPENHPQICLAFVNITQYEAALHQQTNHPLVRENFEFVKSMYVLYDPRGQLQALHKLELPSWVRRSAMRDAMSNAIASFGKYETAYSKGHYFAAQFLKLDTIWSLIKAIAVLLDVQVSAKYDYERLKEDIETRAAQHGLEALLPEHFFERLELCVQANHPHLLKELVLETRTLIDRFTK